MEIITLWYWHSNRQIEELKMRRQHRDGSICINRNFLYEINEERVDYDSS